MGVAVVMVLMFSPLELSSRGCSIKALSKKQATTTTTELLYQTEGRERKGRLLVVWLMLLLVVVVIVSVGDEPSGVARELLYQNGNRSRVRVVSFATNGMCWCKEYEMRQR